VGRTLASLRLDEKYHFIISRIRRGDIEMLAKGNTILELGDRIRFVARREDLEALSKLFGDSYTESARVNLFSFGLGIGIGLLLGNIDITLGAISFKLGYAGGPLIAGLILGALRRTGPIVWSLPYSANVTLQQIGLILLLATIGVRSGHSFIQALDNDTLVIVGGSVLISLFTAIVTLIVGFKLVKIPFSLLMGIVSNQPAILDFALAKAGNRLPMFGYTMMFPLALISKVVIAQILFLLLY
jgi:putative transport protein